MGFVQKPRLTKRNFIYAGLLTCGHCGCAITAEQKTKKSGLVYVYYHCTNGKGRCEDIVFLREEVLTEAFTKALQNIRISPDIVEWTREALLESSRDEKEFRDATVKALTLRYQKLGQFIFKAYDDKLAGTIEPEMWEAKNAQWKKEQQDIEVQLQAHGRATAAYLEEGVKLMDLASKAAEVYPSLTIDEKRELLSLLLSNPRFEDGSVRYDYKKPFDMFANVTDLSDWRGVPNSTPTKSKVPQSK